MQELLALMTRHGAALLALVCFIEAIGFPLPAALALLCAGALVDQGRLSLGSTFFAGVGGLLAGDLILFWIGRTSGWWLLGMLCRLAMNPESCIYSSAQTFYKRGRAALLFTKFVPGINTMAAPLAGSLNMRVSQFLMFDLAGALIYAGTYFLIGNLFSGVLSDIARRMAEAGRAAQGVLAGVIAGYLAYRVWMAWKLREEFFDIPRVSPAEAAQALEDGVVLDVRSHGYYRAGAERIKGSSRLEPNRLADALHELPEDKKIYLYCT